MAWIAARKLYEQKRSDETETTNRIPLLARDSLYYFGLFATSVFVNIAIVSAAPVTPGGSAISFVQVACAIGGCRFLLHVPRMGVTETLRSAGEPEHSPEKTSEEPPRPSGTWVNGTAETE